MITPLSHANGCLTQKYINSDFDHVVNVSENMQSIKNVELNEHQINNVSDNMDAVKNVHHHMNDVLHVSGNMDDINKVVADEVDIGKVADNITEVVQVANGMENYQIVERFTLLQGQVTIVLNKIMAKTAVIEVSGQMVDGTYLIPNMDYTTEGSTITFVRSYPAGTHVTVTQAVYKTDEPIVLVDDQSAFNRKLVPLAIGADISPYVLDGRTVLPRLLVRTTSYVNISDITDSTHITSLTTVNYPNGDIEITTNQGVKRFSKSLGEAVTKKDLLDNSINIEATEGMQSINLASYYLGINSVYIWGIRQIKGKAWEWVKDENKVTINFAEPLQAGDEIEIVVDR